MRNSSRRGSVRPKLVFIGLLALAACGKDAAIDSSNSVGASPSQPSLPSPYDTSKVQLDYESMMSEDPAFAQANPQLASGDNPSDPSRVVLPTGTHLTTLVKNGCLSQEQAQSDDSEISTPLSEQAAAGETPNEDLDVQAYATVTDHEMTLADLSEQANRDACVVGVANDATVDLDPKDMEETPAYDGSDEGEDEGTLASSNDPYLSSQKFMTAINASAAYDTFYNPSTGIKTPVVIAIVDTGIYYTHSDLKANMWSNSKGYHGYDFVNGDNSPLDDAGHGTHCAGLAGAVRNNGIGVSGVMGTDARLMAVKVLSSSGSGTTTRIVNGINYAVKNGANVISMSFGGMGKNSAYLSAITNAINSGVTVVAAAGNSGYKLTSTTWHSPSSYARDLSGFISVGSVDSVTLNRSSFSNYSAAGYVEIGSPGSNGILSTLKGGGYGYKSGTSMATPITAGAAALTIGLLKSRGYATPPALIEQLVRDGGTARSSQTSYFTGGKVLNLDGLARTINVRYPAK